MTAIRATVIGAALLIGSVATAGAADLYGGRGGSIKDGGYAAAPTHSSPMGFYVRGDVTHSWNNVGGMFEPPVDEHVLVGTGNNWMFGIGAGYHFTKNVRGDVTFDWGRTQDLHGTVANPGAMFPGERKFGVKSDVLLANLYYDFNGGSHFSPYIGVGLGAARNTTTHGTIQSCACTTAEFDGATQWHAAGALMAGVTLQLKDRWSLDAGYRFLYKGDAHTGDVRGTTIAAPLVTTYSADPKVSDLYSHQLRVGVRFDIK